MFFLCDEEFISFFLMCVLSSWHFMLVASGARTGCSHSLYRRCIWSFSCWTCWGAILSFYSHGWMNECHWFWVCVTIVAFIALHILISLISSLLECNYWRSPCTIFLIGSLINYITRKGCENSLFVFILFVGFWVLGKKIIPVKYNQRMVWPRANIDHTDSNSTRSCWTPKL